METAQSNDRGSAPGDPKLIPEWSVDADDQIVVLGLLVVGVFVVLLGWNALTGDDGESVEFVVGDAVSASTDDGPSTAAAPSLDPPITLDPTTTAAPTTTTPTTTTPTTTTPSTSEAAASADPAPLLAAAVEPFGSVASDATDGLATLTGFVGTEADRTTAGEAAAGVAGIAAVDNQLVVIEPDVVAALSANGVMGVEVEMIDTTATARGEVADDDTRAAALAAAVAVPGVTAVVDELTVPTAATAVAELNALFELEPIQFASGSADILPASFTTLDRAAAILGDNTASIEVQGYTDVRGPEVTNFTLSQARADAVVAYLTDNGVTGETLTANGYGETTQFREGESPEALAANRRVRFELL